MTGSVGQAKRFASEDKMICGISVGVKDTYLYVLSLGRATPNIPIATRATTLTTLNRRYVLVWLLSFPEGKAR